MPAQHLPLNTGMIIARYSHGRRPNTQQGSKAQAKIKTLTRHGWRRRGSRLIKSGNKPPRHRSNVGQKMKTPATHQPCKRCVSGISNAPMKTLTVLALSLVCGFPLQAQDEGGAKLVSPVADGTPALPAPPKELPAFTVRSTTVRQLEDRKIIMQRVSDPGLPDAPPPPPPATKEELEALRASLGGRVRIANYKETKLILLSASVVDGKASFVRWYHEGEEFQAWSNVNFNHLSGFSEFESDRKSYHFIMAVGDISTAKGRKSEWPGKPPELGVAYPAFTLIKGDKSKGDALAIMIALHDLYENEQDKLTAAHQGRLRASAEREAWLRANPPQPQDTVIQFWPRKGSRYFENNTQKEGAR